MVNGEGRRAEGSDEIPCGRQQFQWIDLIWCRSLSSSVSFGDHEIGEKGQSNCEDDAKMDAGKNEEPPVKTLELEPLLSTSNDGLYHRIRSMPYGTSLPSTSTAGTRSSLPTRYFYLRSIRFQVVIWYIGPVDVVLGRVDMKFRVTVFWNVPDDDEFKRQQVGASTYGSYGLHNPLNKKVWEMHGRQRAFERELSEILPDSKMVYVPPVSIVNAMDFEAVGAPEVCLLDERNGLMKWSCLYKATLIQDDMKVANFPHDEHELVLKLAILKHRQPKKRWDMQRWTLALATDEDNRDSTSIPHGLLVDHVKVPGFSHGSEGLQFEFVPLFGGKGKGNVHRNDDCLQIKLRVIRDSSYYDKNIIPLLAALNLAATSTMALKPEDFGSRGEIILAIAFVEIGIRMTLDSRLPSVGYEIKIQGVLNNFFFCLIFLTLESSVVYLMDMDYGGRFEPYTTIVDQLTTLLALLHTLIMLIWYFKDNGP